MLNRWRPGHPQELSVSIFPPKPADHFVCTSSSFLQPECTWTALPAGQVDIIHLIQHGDVLELDLMPFKSANFVDVGFRRGVFGFHTFNFIGPF